jgi:NAD(P)-dependent dehydrogenase (short-subunit alcohol dehydrogenase family)
MKIVITGHTKGIGKALYDHWTSNGHEVTGISRLTGYNFFSDQDRILEEIKKSDLFVNNANVENFQEEFLLSALNKVNKIIVMGNGLHHYPEYGTFSYIDQKRSLFNTIKKLIANPKTESKILHLGLTFLPDEYIDESNFINWEKIILLIDVWINNPVFWDINYNWKMSESVFNKLSQVIPNLKNIS